MAASAGSSWRIVPGRGVARVHERRLTGFRTPLVERGEVFEGHVDLASHLHQRRRVVDPQRDGADRAQIVRDVLADLAVAAGGTALEHAVAVEQADRQAVDLRLHDIVEAGLLDALSGQVVAHPLDPGAQLLGRAYVAEREHRLEVLDLFELAHRFAADPLGGRVGAQQGRVIALEGPQLVEQAIVGVVADLRVVEDVVAVRVVAELLAQLGRPLDGLGRRGLARGLLRPALRSRSRVGRERLEQAVEVEAAQRVEARVVG